MRHFKPDTILSVGASILLLCSISNLTSTIQRLYFPKYGSKQYSYVGNDFPEVLPMPELDTVLMTVEDSVHYPISGPGAEEEWTTVYPSGFGFVRLGPVKRILCVSMFHQLHCIDKLRRALDNPDDPVATIPHLQHCMNYIRQMILCSSDTTLEPETYDPVRNVSEATGVGVTHTCRNWGAVYGTIEENYSQWVKYWTEVSGNSTLMPD